MDEATLRDEVRAGRIGVDQLVDLVVRLQAELDSARREIADLRKRLEAAESRAGSGIGAAYSVEAEERRQEEAARVKGTKRRRKATKAARRGRLKTADKVALDARSEDVYPAGVDPAQCRHSHSRPVWRLENGRAVLVAYRVHRCGALYGQVPGVLGRCEFGVEIMLAIAYQTYVIGLSLDKVCETMGFFNDLKLRKSQADALLNRLAREWESEFDILCTLLANSAVVHADETSWSIKSVWAFLSEKVRLLFYGVNKDARTLASILDPATFAGLVISDDAAVYGDFAHSQKCWAHLLRKAIKLTLQKPGDAQYRAFADGLLETYRAACRVQSDKRLSDAGRARKVGALENDVIELCGPRCGDDSPAPDEVENDYRRLANEVMRLCLDGELFPFVTVPPVKTPHGEKAVSGTNNESERTLRNPAQARDTNRTSKTPRGARRRTVIHSVLESLRVRLPVFTLRAIVAEVTRWTDTANSLFADLAEKLGLGPPPGSILDRVMPDTAAA